MGSMRLISLLTLSLAGVAQAAWIQQGDGSASFDAKGPAGFKIHGEAKKVVVTDDGKALKVTLLIKDIDTDNSLRNGHMQEDTGAAQYPELSLSVPLEALKVPADGASVEAETKGTFGMHGQTKEIPFKYKATCTAGVCAIEGSANVNVNDYGVKIRSYLGVTVKPEVVVGAKFSVKK